MINACIAFYFFTFILKIPNELSVYIEYMFDKFKQL